MELARPFSKLSKSDVAIAGGKGASLGEMLNAGIPVPDGYVVLSSAFEQFIKETDLNVEIDSILDTVKHEEIHTVEEASERIQSLILNEKMPKDIEREILTSFKKLGAEYVAVRSSATSEDSASAAWAGQLDSYLNTIENNLLENVKRCWASLFTPRAIFYRFEKDLHGTEISVAVVVQKMVDSEESGIAFSVHPVTQDYNQLIIEAGFGLGEAIVQGSITPDSYVVDKQNWKIIDINVNEQEKGLFRKQGGDNEWKELGEKGKQQVLSEKEITELSKLIVRIEKHYGFPCDIEWAKEKDKFYIVQSRPITTLNLTSSNNTEEIFTKTKEDYFITTQYEGFPAIWLADLFLNTNGREIIRNKLGYLPYIFHICYKEEGKPYYVAIQNSEGTDLDKNYGKKFWTNKEKYSEYINDIKKIIEETHGLFIEYKNSFSKANIERRDGKEIADFLRRIFILNSFGTAIHYITEEKLVEPLKQIILELEKKTPDEFIITSDYITSSNLINDRINKVIIDASKKGDIKQFLKQNPNIEREIDELIDEYEYIDWTLLGGKFISWETIGSKFEEVLRDKSKLEEIKRSYSQNNKLRETIIKKEKFYKELNEDESYKLSLISNLGYYRFENQNRTLVLTRIIKEISEYLADRFGIEKKEFEFYKLNELINLVEEGKAVEKSLIEERKEGWAYLLKSDKVEPLFLTAKEFSSQLEVKRILDHINKQKRESRKSLHGVVANFPNKDEFLISGEAYVIKDFYNPEKELKEMPRNKILIVTQTYPNYVPYMKLAKAIVTEVGGLTSHAAIVSRELHIPCIVGVKNAMTKIKDGDKLELDTEKGTIDILEKEDERAVWVKEGEVPLNEDKSLFLLNDILLYPVISRVEKRTGISEGVISYIDRKEKVNKIYTSQDKKRGDWGYEFFLDDKKFNKFLEEVKEIYKKSEEFRNRLNQIDLENIALSDLKEIFSKDIETLWQSKVLVYFTIDPYSWKIEESLKEGLVKILPKEEFEKVFGTLVLQEEKDALENERHSWIKNIILPALEKRVKPKKIKNNEEFLSRIKEHLKTYQSYSAGFGMKMWDMDYYLKLLEEDLGKKEKELKEEFLSLHKKAEINKTKKQEIIEKFDISKDLVKKAYILGKLANLRLDLRVMSWSFYVHVLVKLLNLCVKKSGLSELEINSLTYEEFINLLNNDLKITKELKRKIDERKSTNILQISSHPRGFEILLDKEAKNRFYSEVGHETKLGNSQTFKGDVACRKGVVLGKVFTFKYGSSDFVDRISKFPKGAILVANLTMPVLMPAIRKASAMVTDGGGITCHAAIVSREFGIPCIIGTNVATKVLKDGDEIEVDTNAGIVTILKKSN